MLKTTTVNYEDNGGGLDLRSSPIKVAPDDSTLSKNVAYDTDGAFFTRNGSDILNVSGSVPNPISGNPDILGLFDFWKSDGTHVEVICAGTAIYTDLTTCSATTVTGLDSNEPIPDMEFITTNDDDYLLWGNGIDTNLKFDGTTWTNLSIAKPSALTLNALAAGSLTGNFSYYVSYARTVSGVIVQESPLCSTSYDVTLTSQQVTMNVPVSSDSQVNARVIYRSSPTSAGVYYRLTTITNNTTTTYTDNTAADGSIEADFDNANAPKSSVFEEFDGYIFYRDDSKKSDLYRSNRYFPWEVPVTSLIILDGEIKCIKRVLGSLVIGTDKSLWVLTDADDEPKRFSSKVGIMNNRCADGKDIIYILGTDRNVYPIYSSDFSQNEMRLRTDIGSRIESLLSDISKSNEDDVCLEYYATAKKAYVCISAPIASNYNDTMLVYNEGQSLAKSKAVWQHYDNLHFKCLKQFKHNNELILVGGDYNGLVWNADDDSLNGDGAEENGSVTSATTTTMTDSTASWTVNEHVGKIVRYIDGTGENQSATVTSNTSDTLSFAAMTQAGDTSTVYTIGGYDAYHYSHWITLDGSFNTIKDLCHLWFNLNTSGDYNITCILQTNFDKTITNQTEIALNLSSFNAIWGVFIWGAAYWGSFSVFHDKIRVFERFRAIRIAFYHRKSGQPFQVNMFGLTGVNHGQLFGSA